MMPDVSLLVMLVTFLMASLGFLVIMTSSSGRMQNIGGGMIISSFVGGTYIGFKISVVAACLTIGFGLLAAVAIYAVFSSGGSF